MEAPAENQSTFLSCCVAILAAVMCIAKRFQVLKSAAFEVVFNVSLLLGVGPLLAPIIIGILDLRGLNLHLTVDIALELALWLFLAGVPALLALQHKSLKCLQHF
jgi:hypothetical protein